MFERFTSQARDVVVGAQVEARQLGHCWIGTEHLLLAMLRQSDSLATQALADAGVRHESARRVLLRVLEGPDALDRDALTSIGIDLDAVRRRVEEVFGPGALDDSFDRPGAGRFGRGRLPWRRAGRRSGGHVPFTEKAKKALELSLREALRLRHNEIGAEHLLLGVLREGTGLGLKVMTELGAEPAEVHRALSLRLRRSA